MLSDELAVFDNLKGRLYLIVHADPRSRRRGRAPTAGSMRSRHRLRHGGAPYPGNPGAGGDRRSPTSAPASPARSTTPWCARRRNTSAPATSSRWCPSQRLSVPFTARPVDVYRALRALNPSPYMYFLDTGDPGRRFVAGNPGAPAARCTARVRSPCARSPARARAARPSRKTSRWRAELLADPKERAEHLMLIDLGRNDVGRISEAGSVQVGEQFVIERYSHVMHIVSEVTGTLKPGLGYADVLRATFPAGTVSGAPKIRALEVIRELEPVKRNVYSGAVGYIGWHGDADTAIAIRTAVIQDGRLHVQAGGGVVYDSDPDAEWLETMNKGRALFRAVAEAARGL
jgi:anthranilate synthase component 1